MLNVSVRKPRSTKGCRVHDDDDDNDDDDEIRLYYLRVIILGLKGLKVKVTL
jgi:hypothetical protein